MKLFPRRHEQKPLGLHDALHGIVPVVEDFIVGRIDGEQLWRPYSDYIHAQESKWHRHALREIESLVYVIDDCVPDGVTPDSHEVDETELRAQLSELLRDAGFNVEGQTRALQRVPLQSATQRTAELEEVLLPVAVPLQAFAGGFGDPGELRDLYRRAEPSLISLAWFERWTIEPFSFALEGDAPLEELQREAIALLTAAGPDYGERDLTAIS